MRRSELIDNKELESKFSMTMTSIKVWEGAVEVFKEVRENLSRQPQILSTPPQKVSVPLQTLL
jgi:hypothetical protein